MPDEIDSGIEIQIGPAFLDLLSAERLRAVAEVALHYEGQPGELAVVITDDAGIQALNRDFLGEDFPTDVLSFSAQSDGGPFVAAPEAGGYLGDVIVSYPRAVEQAREHDHAVEQELSLLIVHGILHLLGYDHADEEEKAVMWARQESILNLM
jgi:probable rRNA maturation factor